jgi:hypothetical protein
MPCTYLGMVGLILHLRLSGRRNWIRDGHMVYKDTILVTESYCRRLINFGYHKFGGTGVNYV